MKPLAAHRIDVVSAFLRDRESLLPRVASGLGSDATFESSIRGSSMAPAIPQFSRLRIRLLGNRTPEPGEILYFLADEGFVVHRMLRAISTRNGGRYYLTRGDNCLAPDKPVREDCVLGVVIAVRGPSGEFPPEPLRVTSALHRFLRAVTIPVLQVSSLFGIPAASYTAALLGRIEDMTRARAGRALRFLGFLRRH